MVGESDWNVTFPSEPLAPGGRQEASCGLGDPGKLKARVFRQKTTGRDPGYDYLYVELMKQREGEFTQFILLLNFSGMSRSS